MGQTYKNKNANIRADSIKITKWETRRVKAINSLPGEIRERQKMLEKLETRQLRERNQRTVNRRQMIKMRWGL